MLSCQEVFSSFRRLLDGEVVAVNSAIIAGFTGSNLGVPVSEAARLLDAAR